MTPLRYTGTVIFASSCAGCGQPGPSPCRPCRAALAATPTPPAHRGPHGQVIRAALPFDGVVKHLVVALKYRNHRRTADLLAAELVRRLGLDRRGDGSRADRAVDVVTWAPTSGRRAARRGYDQAELLARAVGRRLGVPCRRLLYRHHGEGHQTGRSRWQRLLGPQFRVRPDVAGMRVLLVDDVVTTGATLAAAVTALGHAGIVAVRAVAVAAADHEVAGSGAPILVEQGI